MSVQKTELAPGIRYLVGTELHILDGTTVPIDSALLFNKEVEGWPFSAYAFLTLMKLTRD